MFLVLRFSEFLGLYSNKNKFLCTLDFVRLVSLSFCLLLNRLCLGFESCCIIPEASLFIPFKCRDFVEKVDFRVMQG